MLDRSAKDNVCNAVDALQDELTKLGLDLGNIMSPQHTARFSDAVDRIYHESLLEDGQIWGYPLVNCKGPMTCCLIAAKALQNAKVRLKGDLVLAAVCGELCGDPVDEFQGHDYL